ncbi:hypothetical protein FY550_14565 [Kushneria phosphatilytica]|uniref:Uncharacterized protein n=2 Tax=Kushneria phosphatilytica TaxID=657387 RepID=A0A5C1A2Y3_9GAMM|nr:hypothetical protein [Kushneria phosphatilytica]QEL12237.1 hypothetical protein FY550_14565 [Kushneria phosphatilytica]
MARFLGCPFHKRRPDGWAGIIDASNCAKAIMNPKEKITPLYLRLPAEFTPKAIATPEKVSKPEVSIFLRELKSWLHPKE